jgi:hypothetical protein
MTSSCTGHCRSVGTSSQSPERKSKEQETLRHFVIVNTGPWWPVTKQVTWTEPFRTIVNSRWGFLFETRRRGEYLSWPFFWRGGGFMDERRVSRMGWSGVGGFSVSMFLQEHGVLEVTVSKLGYKFNYFLQNWVHQFHSCFHSSFILLRRPLAIC